MNTLDGGIIVTPWLLTPYLNPDTFFRCFLNLWSPHAWPNLCRLRNNSGIKVWTTTWTNLRNLDQFKIFLKGTTLPLTLSLNIWDILQQYRERKCSFHWPLNRSSSSILNHCWPRFSGNPLEGRDLELVSPSWTLLLSSASDDPLPRIRPYLPLFSHHSWSKTS